MIKKKRNDIVNKGEKIKKILDEGANSILILGEPDCGKSMLFGYLENSLKNQPAVFELSNIKGKSKRRYKLKKLSDLPYSIILIDDADRLDQDSTINSLNSLDGKSIIMFSRDLESISFIKKNVDKVIFFSEIL